MRNGQNKRMRGRNRKSQNPMTRVFESNGPDVKIRGNPSHIAEKYLQLARDAQASGDPVAAENYFQHAEHYFRLIAAAQEQFRQGNPQFYRPETEIRNEGDDEGDEMPHQPSMLGGTEVPFGTREPQPFLPRDSQPYPVREQPVYSPRPQPQATPQVTSQVPLGDGGGDVDRLPSFITGAPPQAQPSPGYGQNGHDGQGDRFPLHRRRRRHRGPRHDVQGTAQAVGGDGEDGSRGSD
jgi:hypothetical protein